METDPALATSRQAAAMAVSSDLIVQQEQDDFWREVLRDDEDGVAFVPLERLEAAAAVQEEAQLEEEVFDPAAEEPISLEGDDPWTHEVVDLREGGRERYEGEARAEMAFCLSEIQAGQEQEAKSVANEVILEANSFLFGPGEGGEESDSNLPASASSPASPMTPPLSLGAIRSRWFAAREKEKRTAGVSASPPSGWIQQHLYTRSMRLVAAPLCDGTSATCACEEHRSGRVAGSDSD